MTDTAELCGAKSARGFNQTTSSGKPFWALDPRPEDVRIEDIAAHLSRICRFGGALKDRGVVGQSAAHGPQFGDYEVYSVAQHSVLVSLNVPEEYALEALLHDAAEAYVGDMIKPVKMAMSMRRAERAALECFGVPDNIVDALPDFKRLEMRVDAAIRERFGLPAEMSEFVKVADYRAVLTEHRDLQICDGSVDWGQPTLEPWPEQIIPVLPSEARRMFMDRFNERYKGD